MKRVALVSMAPVEGGWSVRRWCREPHGVLELTHEGASAVLTIPSVEEFRLRPAPACALQPPRLAGLGL